MPAKKLIYSGTLYTDRRRFYPSPQLVAELYPAVTPFLSSIFARGGQRVPDKNYKMFEHRSGWRYQRLRVDEGAPSGWSPDGTPGGTDTVGIDNLEGVSDDEGLIGHEVEIWNEDETVKKGVALITAWDSSNGITLKVLGNPGDANFTVSDLEDNDRLFIISTAFGEGDDAPEAQSDELKTVNNSVQREKTAVEITEDLRRAVLRGYADEMQRLRNEKQNEHKIKQERKFLFGMKPGGIGGVAHGAGGGTDSGFGTDFITDASGRNVTTTMGVFPAMERYGRSDNADDQQNYFVRDASTYDYITFVSDMEKVFQYVPMGQLTAYCGLKVMSFWSSTFVKNNSKWDITISGMQTSRLGFNYRILETPHGIMRLVPMPIFRQTPYDAQMLYVQDEYVTLKQYAPDEYVTNIKTDNDPDLMKDQFKSWSGLGLTLMERHGVFKFNGLL